MKKLAITLVAMLALTSSAFAANAVRISQAYGGGGSSSASASYQQDYVEIFNSSAVAVNIGSWTIEYGSATGNWGSSAGNIFTFPANTMIQPCGYLFVALGSAGTGGAAFPVTPDFSNTTTNMSGSAGKVALFNAVNANVACGSEAAGTLVDKVAYGTSNCPEVTATAAVSVSTAAVRNGGGLDDTDNNVNDFTIASNPVPRNASSPQNPLCLPTPTNNSTWGQLKSIYR